MSSSQQSGINRILFGQSAVHRVASEFMLRGYNVYFPSVDIGADIILDNGIRVQVKATRLVIRASRTTGSYIFQLHGYRLNSSTEGKRWRKKSRHFSRKCDFVVLYGQTEQKFWIVPAMFLDGKSHVMLSIEDHGNRCPSLTKTIKSFENRWDVIESFSFPEYKEDEVKVVVE